MREFAETLYDSYQQSFRIDKLYFESKTEHQHLMIFHNAKFGRVMVLDGIVQTTELDEFIYHEMLAHLPIIAHGDARRVLIVGGGDGGMLREVVKHRTVEAVTQVEIDPQVIEMAREYLPNHSAGAYDDERLELVFGDGSAFVRDTDQRFDVIISDSTDPVGPGEVLFTSTFYEDCRRCLKPGGILVAQNGVAFMQLDEVTTTAKRLAPLFSDWHFYGAAVPTYIGGMMTFAWATDEPAHRQLPVETVRARIAAADIKTKYYNADIHVAAFALPQYIVEAIGKQP